MQQLGKREDSLLTNTISTTRRAPHLIRGRPYQHLLPSDPLRRHRHSHRLHRLGEEVRLPHNLDGRGGQGRHGRGHVRPPEKRAQDVDAVGIVRLVEHFEGRDLGPVRACVPVAVDQPVLAVDAVDGALEWERGLEV